MKLNYLTIAILAVTLVGCGSDDDDNASAMQSGLASQGEAAFAEAVADGEDAIAEGEDTVDQAVADGEDAIAEGEDAVDQAVADGEDATAEGEDAINQAVANVEDATAEGEDAVDQAVADVEDATAEGEDAVDQAVADVEDATAEGEDAVDQAVADVEDATAEGGEGAAEPDAEELEIADPNTPAPGSVEANSSLTEAEFAQIFAQESVWQATATNQNLTDREESLEGKTGYSFTQTRRLTSGLNGRNEPELTTCNGAIQEPEAAAFTIGSNSLSRILRNLNCPIATTTRSYDGSSRAVIRTDCDNGNFYEVVLERTNKPIHSGQATIDQTYARQAATIPNMCAIAWVQTYENEARDAEFEARNFEYGLYLSGVVQESGATETIEYESREDYRDGIVRRIDRDAGVSRIDISSEVLRSGGGSPTSLEITTSGAGMYTGAFDYSFVDGVTPRANFTVDLTP